MCWAIIHLKKNKATEHKKKSRDYVRLFPCYHYDTGDIYRRYKNILSAAQKIIRIKSDKLKRIWEEIRIPDQLQQ